jgi:hypothetical protein
MEKLIELIVEFQKEIWQTTYDLDMYHYDDKLKLIIIWSDVSKWYIDYIDIFRLLFAPWFIKWLVDNDKIDRTDLWKREMMLSCTKYENLLMWLSISDTPIEDLISYLK